MRYVGVVSGIFDDAGAGLSVRLLGERQGKSRSLPAGQADHHGIGKLPVSSAANAARAAAAAQAPVVQPRRNGAVRSRAI